MSKIRYNAFKSPTGPISDKVYSFLFILLLLLFLSHNNISHASDFSSDNYELTYEKNLISLSATKADLKSILFDIAEKADISIRYPASLDTTITLKIRNTSLKKALKRLLKDFNYSIIYSGSKKQAVISDVYILQKTKKSTQVNSNSNSNEARIVSRIKSYERRIESLKKNLSTAGENSARGKRYLNQIESYEKTIERLKSQLN